MKGASEGIRRVSKQGFQPNRSCQIMVQIRVRIRVQIRVQIRVTWGSTNLGPWKVEVQEKRESEKGLAGFGFSTWVTP